MPENVVRNCSEENAANSQGRSVDSNGFQAQLPKIPIFS